MLLDELVSIQKDKIMITITQKGDFKNTEKLLNSSDVLRLNVQRILEGYGLAGVNALSDATPKDTGLTADSWSYEIVNSKSWCSVTWSNSNSEFGVPVAILIQYGHGTKNGTYVQGIDFINPAIRPIIDKIALSIYEEVSNL
jgi:hypothetical protein